MVHVSIEDVEAAKDKDEIAKDHFAKSNKKPFTKRRKEARKLTKQEQSDDTCVFHISNRFF